jgi:hypothetical protein
MRTNGGGRDNPLALAFARKLFAMSAEQQIPGARGIPVAFLLGPEGAMVAKEHGELGEIQNFAPGETPNVLIGGGRPRSFTDAVSREPNSVGLSAVAAQLLASDQLKQARY